MKAKASKGKLKDWAPEKPGRLNDPQEKVNKKLRKKKSSWSNDDDYYMSKMGYNDQDSKTYEDKNVAKRRKEVPVNKGSLRKRKDRLVD